MESEGKLLGHTENNPKHNVSMISLTGMKSYEGPSRSEPEKEDEKQSEQVMEEKETKKVDEKETPKKTNLNLKVYKSLLPFSSWQRSTKHELVYDDIIDNFRKAEVTIPLLDTIKQVPWYAMFLKD